MNCSAAGSSNGKTPASGAGYRGSSPCPAASGGGLLRLVAVQAPVRPLRRQQLLVGALLDDAAVVEHDDPAGAADGRQPVGDDDRRAAGQKAPQARLDAALRVDVDVRGGLVEHEDPRV